MEKKLALEPNQDKLNGVLVRSTIEHGTIKNITIPPNDGEFVIVSAQDFGEDNSIEVVDTQYPILASTDIEYKGQPILAVFSYDYESSKLFAQEIQIEYETREAESMELSPFSVSWGNTEEFIGKPEYKTVNGLYYFGQQSTPGTAILKVRADFDGRKIVVEAPTQWPFHIKETLSRVFGIPITQVMVEVKSYYSPKDENLLHPTYLAALAAAASKKGRCKAEITSFFPVFKPEIIINRCSVLDDGQNVVAEEVVANVDLGAYPLFTKEMALQMLSGLMPVYNIPNFNLRTSMFVTNKPPAHFFGTLGVSECFCSSEVQYSKIANSLGISPGSWRLDHISPNPEYQMRVHTASDEFLKQSIREIVESSGYQRKHFAFQQQRKKKNKLNSLLNYARGIGIACAPGFNGFSNHFQNLPFYSVKATLDANGKLIINTSFPQDAYVSSIWISMIAKKMKISSDDIIFESSLSEELSDSGPDVLSRNIGNISDLILAACDNINSRRFKEPLPLVTTVSTEVDNSKPLFESHAWVAVVIELEIDPVLILPIVKKCWVSASFEIIFDQRILDSKMKRVIETTITELGGKPDPEMESVISFRSQKEGKASSINQALKGALAAAFTSALSQAINVEQIKLPVSSEYLLEVIKGQ